MSLTCRAEWHVPDCPVQEVYASPWPPASWSRENEYGVLIGLMASDARLAVRALRDWCQELGIEYVVPENKVWHAYFEEEVGAINAFLQRMCAADDRVWYYGSTSQHVIKV